MSPYQRLANAIVELAAADYRSAVKALAQDERNDAAREEVRELERFFRSRWYGLLTDVDGEYLMERLKSEVVA